MRFRPDTRAPRVISFVGNHSHHRSQHERAQHVIMRCLKQNSIENSIVSAFPDNPMDRPSPGEPGIRLPNQASTIVQGDAPVAVIERETKVTLDTDYMHVRSPLRM